MTRAQTNMNDAIKLNPVIAKIWNLDKWFANILATPRFFLVKVASSVGPFHALKQDAFCNNFGGYWTWVKLVTLSRVTMEVPYFKVTDLIPSIRRVADSEGRCSIVWRLKWIRFAGASSPPNLHANRPVYPVNPRLFVEQSINGQVRCDQSAAECLAEWIDFVCCHFHSSLQSNLNQISKKCPSRNNSSGSSELSTEKLSSNSK